MIARPAGYRDSGKGCDDCEGSDGSEGSEGDEGAATIAGVGVILAVVALAASLGYHLTGVVNDHRAKAAADMTAISAATVQVTSGTEEACIHAAIIAEKNGGSLTRCRETMGGSADAPQGGVGEIGVYVEVTVIGRTARAAAGPLEL